MTTIDHRCQYCSGLRLAPFVRLVQGCRPIQQKCANGCTVRAVIADPESRYVADRDDEEDLAMTLVVRIDTSLKFFAPLMQCENFEMRQQDVPLYNSVFRFDDEMLVTPHLYATPGSSAPMLHLRRLGPNGMFSRFATHFDSIWATTTPVRDDRPRKAARAGRRRDA
jgi:hypothetical protein